MYLVYHDPQDAQNYKELFVLEEKWEKESAKTAITHLVKTDELNHVGAWRIEPGQELIILGKPEKYMSCMLAVDRDWGEQDRTMDLGTSSTAQHQPSMRTVIARQSEPLSQYQEKPAVGKIRQVESMTNKELPTTHQEEHCHSKRTLRVSLIALHFLQSHIRTSPLKSGILLPVPASYPSSNYEISLLNRLSGDHWHFLWAPLPIWSVYSQRMSCLDDTKIASVSPWDIHAAITNEILKYEDLLGLKRMGRCYKEDGRKRREILMLEHFSHPDMPTTPRDRALDCAIQSRLQELIPITMPKLMPMFSANDVPHPPTLSHSSDNFPLPPNIANTLQEYLHNSLNHPAISSHGSFHAAVLTSNHALCLKPVSIRGLQIQWTHAFDATLTEMRGTDGVPAASRSGHAVVIFFPKSDNCESSHISDARQNFNHETRWIDDCVVSGRSPSGHGRDNESISSSSNELTMDHIQMCMSLETGHHYLQERPRLSSQEAVTGSTMPLILEFSKTVRKKARSKNRAYSCIQRCIPQ